jgi:hypothetical protein
MNHNLPEPTIIAATYTEDYKIEFIFADGVCGILDFRELLRNPRGNLKKLEDVSFFRRVRFNPVTETVEWPNNADFSPHYLYEHTLLQNPNAPKLNMDNIEQYYQYLDTQRRLRIPPVDEVSFFNDISISMRYTEGVSPRFYTAYKNYSTPTLYTMDHAVFEIETGRLVEGILSPTGVEYIQEWRGQRLAELREAWKDVQAGRKTKPIAPVD